MRDLTNISRHELTTAMQHLCMDSEEGPWFLRAFPCMSSLGKVLRVASN